MSGRVSIGRAFSAPILLRLGRGAAPLAGMVCAFGAWSCGLGGLLCSWRTGSIASRSSKSRYGAPLFWAGSNTNSEVFAQEGAYGHKEFELGQGAEPVALVWKNVGFVGDFEAGELGVQIVGAGDRDDVVGFAMKDERGWEGAGGLGGEGVDEAA